MDRREICGILHPSDFSSQGEIAYAHAVKIALEAKTKLNIVHVEHDLDNLPEFPGVREILSRWGVLPEGAARSDLHRIGLGVRKSLHLGKSVTLGVLDELASEPADMIVLGTHRRKGIDWFIHDEIANRIVRSSRLLTLFVPYEVGGFVRADNGETNLRRILLPIDASPSPQAAIEAACTMASVLNSSEVEFIVVHVGADGPQLSELELPQRSGWEWSSTSRKGNVGREILALADERSVDLIVMTTRGPDGFLDALRGSTTERVLHEAQCPVLAAPAPT